MSDTTGVTTSGNEPAVGLQMVSPVMPHPAPSLATQVGWMEQCGFRFVVRDGELHVTAPAGAMTQAHRRFLSERKAELLAHFASNTEVF